MRQLLVSGLVNHPGHYRLEANRWLSEIALLLATRFSQPIASTPRRDTEKWSRRIASVVARIDANYQRRLSLQEVAAAEFVSGLAVTLISQRGRGKFCPVPHRAAPAPRRRPAINHPQNRPANRPRTGIRQYANDERFV